jgi:hypothetical protein
MMFRYWLIICLLLLVSVACSPTTSEATEPQSVEGEEMSDEEHTDDHNDEHDDKHDEEEEHEEHEEDADHREHGAHEHGAAILTIAWSGNDLAIDLETPAYNVVGFEYAPTSEEEKALLDESIAALEAEGLLQLSPEADCIFTSANVQTELSEAEHEEEEDAEETHSDIDVAYAVQCENPDDLESLDASGLFARFPNFESLEVQWISDTQQSATELTQDDPVVSLR